MIKKILCLYQHWFRRSPEIGDFEEHPLDWKATQIRLPLTEIEYVQNFGLDFVGRPATITLHEDGSNSITLLDDSPREFAINESAKTFTPT